MAVGCNMAPFTSEIPRHPRTRKSGSNRVVLSHVCEVSCWCRVRAEMSVLQPPFLPVVPQRSHRSYPAEPRLNGVAKRAGRRDRGHRAPARRPPDRLAGRRQLRRCGRRSGGGGIPRQGFAGGLLRLCETHGVQPGPVLDADGTPRDAAPAPPVGDEDAGCAGSRSRTTRPRRRRAARALLLAVTKYPWATPRRCSGSRAAASARSPRTCASRPSSRPARRPPTRGARARADDTGWRPNTGRCRRRQDRGPAAPTARVRGARRRHTDDDGVPHFELGARRLHRDSPPRRLPLPRRGAADAARARSDGGRRGAPATDPPASARGETASGGRGAARGPRARAHRSEPPRPARPEPPAPPARAPPPAPDAPEPAPSPTAARSRFRARLAAAAAAAAAPPAADGATTCARAAAVPSRNGLFRHLRRWLRPRSRPPRFAARRRTGSCSPGGYWPRLPWLRPQRGGR